MFERFCKEETGFDGNWEYLSDERKAAWMEEALLSIELVINTMQQAVKPIPTPHKFETVWAQGFFSGQSSERTEFIGHLHNTLKSCKQELTAFKNNSGE